VKTTALALAAEVATSWFSLVEQRGQLALLDQQVENNARVLDLITLRFRRGQVGAADVLRQRQLLERNRGERAQVEELLELREHQLAVLLGAAPGHESFEAQAQLPEVSALPETGLPSALLERRPDVQRAFARVLAADRRAAAALADRYPRLELSYVLRMSAADLGDVMDTWLASFTANVVGPLFDAGLRDSEVDRNRALLSERIHDYGQVVLTALREVEDALAQQRHRRELLSALQAQLTLSEQTLNRVRDRYLKGTVGYLDVLSATLTQQGLERDQLRARAELLGLRIALHRALAGGFELPEPALAVPKESRS